MESSGHGAGNQGQPSNQVGLHQNLALQQWMQQREDLRQMKAVIEDAERRMEMGMLSQLNQQQQMAPSLFGGPPVSSVFSPGLAPPYSNPAPTARSPPLNESARIVEIGSDPFSPNGSPTMANSNFATRNTPPQALSHVSSQRGPSYASASQPGPSNMQYTYGRPQSQHGGQRLNNIPFSTSSASHAQRNQYTSSQQFQQGQSQAINATYQPPPQMTNQPSHQINAGQHDRVATAYASAVSRQAGSQSNATAQPSSHNFSGAQNGVEPRQSNPRQDPSSQSLGGHAHSNTHGAIGKTSLPISYTIPPGPGQIPLRRSAHATGTQMSAPNKTTAATGDIALTPGFGPAQATKPPIMAQDVSPSAHQSNSTSSRTVPPQASTVGQSHVSEAQSSGPLTSPIRRAAHTLVPVSSSPTVAPGVLPSQMHGEAASDPHLAALVDLNKLLASHDQWSDAASNRIIHSVLGASDEPPTSGDASTSQVVVHPTPTSKKPLPTSGKPSEQTQTVRPPSPLAVVTQIMNAHESKSAAGEATLPKDDNSKRTSPKPGHLPSQPQIPHHNYQSRFVNGVVPPSGVAGVSNPHTPVALRRGVSPTTTSSANRDTLAHDIIRALQPPSTKRKRVETQGGEGGDNNASVESPLAKRSKTATVSASGASQTAAVSGVTNKSDVRYPREGTGSVPAAPVQQPPLPRFNQWPIQAYQSFPSTSQGQYSTPSYANPFQFQWVPVQGPQNISYPPAQSSSYFKPAVPWQPHSVPLSWPPYAAPYGQDRQPEAGPSAPQHPKRAANVEHVSIPSIPAASNPSERSADTQPIKHPTTALTPRPSEVATANSISSPKGNSRTPLFLPSSESPPGSPPLGSSPSQKPSGLIPVIELGPSLSKLKSKTHLVKGGGFPKSEASSPSPLLDPASDAEPFFGVPTGALAIASSNEVVTESPPGVTSQATFRRSRSEVYVLIPNVDTTEWLYSSGSPTPEKEHLSERRRPIDKDSFLVQDFARRLIRRPCLWKNCHAVLDSAEKLLKHVKVMHGTHAGDELYRCHWKECQSNSCYADSGKFIHHLQWHVTARMYCGYVADCEFQTRLAERLTEHVADEHDEDDLLRPIAVPSEAIVPEPRDLVETLPSYLSVPLPVVGQSISKERHQKIGPWVSTNLPFQGTVM
ncbi:hypothetical protein JB92DRAFT_3140467 [Gautieria morchelliformis]|nr:hypothetical protein JB92DRAFT_3140467 [Gautieria morchelliformis]